ncbi:hypothetical protein [Azohydromonas lata]|uniref:Transposase n=1 Tax=Azohydromonas lata TaxID=45677 RepID=A0ABU5IPT3_9BURK|nr:hypothetical protein [Azohydromonas lata]MDZ5460912.1 hypothetical protein [Azohydromonas lata]
MKKNQSYTAEFRAEAVKLVTEQKLSHQEMHLDPIGLGLGLESLGDNVAIYSNAEPVTPCETATLQ